jgi:hypothetical protein
MTGKHAGVVMLLEKECSNPELRTWCVPHHLDLVFKKATHGIWDEALYNTAHAFTVHLRAQPKFIHGNVFEMPEGRDALGYVRQYSALETSALSTIDDTRGR